MKSEDLVPTLETCQKLEKAGIKFDSYFSWWKPIEWEIGTSTSMTEGFRKVYKAPTIPELLEKMPLYIEKYYQRTIYDNNKVVYRTHDGIRKFQNIIQHENLAEALAQMRLWLHKEGYLQ